jgi:cobalt-precorrin-5B (C1)-methyltransferase
LKTGAILFSNVYGILGETAGAEELLKLHQNNA